MVPAVHTPPRIIVQAGPSLSQLKPVHVNRDVVHISTDRFEGDIWVGIQDYSGPTSDLPNEKKAPDSSVWSEEGNTLSLKIEGRFKHEVDADDLMFGNCWEKPIRDYLPYGTAAALKFVHFVDPALSHDLYADKPWALSPVIATMNYLRITKDGKPSTSIPCAIQEDVSAVLPPSGAESLVGHAEERRKYFANEAHRKGITLGPDTTLQADFCNGFINFDPLALKLPIGMSFPLAKYWNGEPVAFVCRTRKSEEPFFIITFTFETLDDEQAEKTGGTAEKASEAPAVEDTDSLGID